MTINHSFGFNLGILSFDLPINFVKESDDIRVSITTYPEQNKQAFVVPARKMKNPYINFCFNVKLPSENIPKDFISTGTEKIIIIFRKKSFFYSDPIVGFAFISVKEFPKNCKEPIQMKTLEIYRTLQKDEMDSKNNNISNNYSFKQASISNRKIIGKMNVKMSLSDPLQLDDFGFDSDQKLDIESKDTFKFSQKGFGFKKLKM